MFSEFNCELVSFITWGELVNSYYNTCDLEINGSNVIYYMTLSVYYILSDSSTLNSVNISDTIVSGTHSLES